MKLTSHAGRGHCYMQKQNIYGSNIIYKNAHQLQLLILMFSVVTIVQEYINIKERQCKDCYILCSLCATVEGMPLGGMALGGGIMALGGGIMALGGGMRGTALGCTADKGRTSRNNNDHINI